MNITITNRDNNKIELAKRFENLTNFNDSNTLTKNIIKQYSYFEMKENEGKLKKVAKIVRLNKFLRIYYGIVKNKYKELEIW